MNNTDMVKQQALEPNQSGFSVKSIGYAAANLILGERELEVYPAEEYGYSDGEITDDSDVIEVEGVDAQGNVYSERVETTNTLAAEWLPMGSNRFTAPNVRRGERLLLWQYADEDKYYWTSLGMDEHLRKRETVVYRFSNTTDESDMEITTENSYSVIVSTHTKEITIQTTKNDGEPFAYFVKLDTGKGHFVLTDDIDNQITLESEAKRITLINADKSMLELDKKDINIVSTNSINLKSKSINMTSNSWSVKSTSMTMNGSTYAVSANTAYTGTLTSNGRNISGNHTHGNVKSGPSKTGGPS